jgi:hypothetical protein
VSPSAALAIVVDPLTGRVEASPRDQATTPGHIALSPASFDVHREFARSFLEGVGDPALRTELAGYLAGNGQWWLRWLQTLRRDPNLLAAWQEHRQHALSDALKHSLAEAGLAEDIATTAFAAIVGSRRKRPSRTQEYRPLPTMASSHELRADELVQIVRYAASRMSDRELRNLLLPLGLTLEALANLRASK